MKQRTAKILQMLIESQNKELNVQYLIDFFGKSEKTLRNDIQDIQSFVGKFGMRSSLTFDGHTFKINDEFHQEKLRDILYSMNTHHYKMSLEERKIYIIMSLLPHKGYYSMQQLADEMCVTRNTIIDDCKIVDTYLREYNITFVAQSNKGIKIIGDEERVDELLIDIFYSLIPDLQSSRSFFVELVMKLQGFRYLFSDVVFHMEHITKKNSMILAKESFLHMAVTIFVMANRQSLGERIFLYDQQNLDSVALDSVGEIISYVFERLYSRGSVSHTIILYIERLILIRSSVPKIQSINDLELYGVICHFLLELRNAIGVELQTDDVLVKSLLSHLKNIKNWNLADIDFSEVYSNSDFFQIKEGAETKYYILEQYLKHPLTSAMRHSIVIHLCAALLRNRQNTNPFSVIISCPGSMATSRYLEAQIKNYFNFRVIDTMSSTQIEETSSQLEDIDFIGYVTTNS